MTRLNEVSGLTLLRISIGTSSPRSPPAWACHREIQVRDFSVASSISPRCGQFLFLQGQPLLHGKQIVVALRTRFPILR